MKDVWFVVWYGCEKFQDGAMVAEPWVLTSQGGSRRRREFGTLPRCIAKSFR